MRSSKTRLKVFYNENKVLKIDSCIIPLKMVANIFITPELYTNLYCSTVTVTVRILSLNFSKWDVWKSYKQQKVVFVVNSCSKMRKIRVQPLGYCNRLSVNLQVKRSKDSTSMVSSISPRTCLGPILGQQLSMRIHQKTKK